MMTMGHAMRQLVTGRKHELSASNAATICSRYRDADPLGLTSSISVGRKGARPLTAAAFNSASALFLRIDHEVAIAHDRGSTRNSELLAERFAVQESARQSGGAARFVLAFELFMA